MFISSFLIFSSGAVYSFKQNEDNKVVAACAEYWYLNCPDLLSTVPNPNASPAPLSFERGNGRYCY